MPLTAFTNTFAGNPLDRVSYKRSDPDWIDAQLADPETLAVALWNGKPLIEDAPGPDPDEALTDVWSDGGSAWRT